MQGSGILCGLLSQVEGSPGVGLYGGSVKAISLVFLQQIADVRVFEMKVRGRRGAMAAEQSQANEDGHTAMVGMMRENTAMGPAFLPSPLRAVSLQLASYDASSEPHCVCLDQS